MAGTQQIDGQVGPAPMRARRRPGALDLIAAVLVVYLSALNSPDPVASLDPQAARAIYIGLLVVCALAIAGRRVAPLAAVIAIGLAMMGHLAAFSQLSLLAVAATLVAVETTQSRLDPPWRWVMLGAAALGTAAASVRMVELVGPEVPLRSFILVSVSWLVMAVAAFTGAWRRYGRNRVEQALERAAVLEAQQATERRLAVVEERQRIARDVHDLLGHSLSVIGMQAEGARAVLAVDAQAADDALAVIGDTARRSVDEVRVLVDVLRADAPGQGAPTTAGGLVRGAGLAADARPVADQPAADVAAVPGHPLAAPRHGSEGDSPGNAASPHAAPEAGQDSVEALVRRARRAGQRVDLHLAIAEDIPDLVDIVLLRAVQEALTNALRHAPGAAVRVELTARDGLAELSVVNGAPASRTPSATASPARRGFGLVAMRERVEAAGGGLVAGPEPDGGWLMRATLPLAPAPGGPTAAHSPGAGCPPGGPAASLAAPTTAHAGA
ncbi:sensor histidine kinase [Actinomyces slackii]|uniref:histidine kinase n=1 Tax=Actinomyces slackii TaxID=52774 RepID=A0A3S4SS99_9ACTO|nr:histidine kinase [Actinomyces slackii]VEG73805.1 Sensor histidine kinase desK [Actinomyces slackii]